MIRATLWTAGLFGAGTAICRVFPWTWTEPLVLVALGLAFLFVSARGAARPRRAALPSPAAAKGAAPERLASPAPIQVERTA